LFILFYLFIVLFISYLFYYLFIIFIVYLFYLLFYFVIYCLFYLYFIAFPTSCPVQFGCNWVNYLLSKVRNRLDAVTRGGDLSLVTLQPDGDRLSLVTL